jgi:hypothetical protein
MKIHTENKSDELSKEKIIKSLNRINEICSDFDKSVWSFEDIFAMTIELISLASKIQSEAFKRSKF